MVGSPSHDSCEHTELLVSKFELGVLWCEYGLIRDIVVCSNLFLFSFYQSMESFYSLLQMISLVLISTSLSH